MTRSVPGRRLSGADAAFLYLERREIPLHIAAVAIFEDEIPFEDFVASIDSKLDLIPRYRQLIEPTALNLSHPSWVEDPNFDIRRHILRVRLDPPGGEVELQALAGRILSQPLDRAKPLWEIAVVEGLKDGRGALVIRVHHALADGISGVALVNIMLDPNPRGSSPARKRRPQYRETAPPEPSHTGTLASAVMAALETFVETQDELIDFASTVTAAEVKSRAGSVLRALPELLAPVERLPFNRRCGTERKFCWTDLSLAEVKAAGVGVGHTVNDVILTILVRAVARYAVLHGETIANRLVRIACPVNTRGKEKGESLGNRITFIPVSLPMDVKDPVAHLRTIGVKMDAMKREGASDVVSLLGGLVASVPPTLQALFWAGLPLLPLTAPVCNLICTNIPGSTVPLYAVGKRMLALYPQVPTGHDLGLGCAVHSYDGKLFFGLIADAGAAPDAPVICEFLNAAFDELRRAAAVEKNPAPAAKTRKRRPKPRVIVPQAAPDPAPEDVTPEAVPESVEEPLAQAAISGQ